MGYAPGTGNQVLTTSYYGQTSTSLSVTAPKYADYEIAYSSVNTNIKNNQPRIFKPDGVTEGNGYRIDVADALNVLAVGDEVNINGKKYKIYEIVTPEFTPDSGKVLSPQIITDNPIEVFPATKRVYRFDISIDVNTV